MSWIAGFLATTAGKTAAGATLAAAGLGGLHTADVVDLPVLPDEASGIEQAEETETPEIDDPVEVDTEVDEVDAETDEVDGEIDAADVRPELPEEAVAGQATAEAKHAAAEAFTTAMQDWAECVATNAEAAQDGDADGDSEETFDPRADCGDRPMPSDSGLTDPPSQAADAADEGRDNGDAGTEASTEGRSTADTAREERGDPTDGGSDTPAPEGAGSQDPTDRGQNTPAPSGRP